MVVVVVGKVILVGVVVAEMVVVVLVVVVKVILVGVVVSVTCGELWLPGCRLVLLTK